MMEENVISKAIVETYMKEFVSNLDVDVAVVGAGPSGLVCAYYLALKGLKVTVYERALRIGGGMPAGGMMFNNIVVEEEAKSIMDEFDVSLKKYDVGLYTADALETISAFSFKTIKKGVKIYNLIGVEDVVIRGQEITGVVLNWSAVTLAHLHVDPLAVKAKAVVDATGHDSELCRIVERKVGGLKVSGEKSMWAQEGERILIENTKEVYPNLFVCGMAANAIYGSPRMGPIFGGMLLSGKKAASLIAEKLNL